MLFDLHISTVMSGGSTVAPEDLIDRALDLGLDGLCVTERNSFAASAVSVEFAEGLPLVVLRGLEIDTDLGELLVYGLDAEAARAFERSRNWSALEAVEYVHARGGVCVPAHPFDPDRPSLRANISILPGLFAIEGFNGRTPDEANQEARRFAERFNLNVVGGSDPLTIAQLGRCVTEFENPVRNEADFLRELRAGRFTARYFLVTGE